MASSDIELRAEVRSFTGIDSSVVSDNEFDTVLSDAKRHIKLRRSMSENQVDWYGDPVQEEALNWATKLFLKVAAGELDGTSISVGAIDHDSLLAKDDEATIWYRNMVNALSRINPTSSFGQRSVGRRNYGSDDESGSGSTLGGEL